MKKQRSDRKEILSQHCEYTLEQMHKMLDEVFQGLTGDQMASARFELGVETYAYDDGSYPKLFMKFDRPETDEEEKKREDQEAHYAKVRADADRANYERLKKQFEVK